MTPVAKPWYLRAFIAISAWFSALFGLSWIGLILRSNETGYFFLGILILVVSHAAARAARESDFLEQMLLALGMIGRGATLYGLSVLINDPYIACAILALAEPLLYAFNPSFSSRFLSVISGLGLGTVFVIKAWPQSPLALLSLLCASLLWLAFEFTPRVVHEKWEERYKPLGWAAAFGLAIWPASGETWQWIQNNTHPNLFTSICLSLGLAAYVWHSLRPQLLGSLAGLLGLGLLTWLLRLHPSVFAALLLGFLAFKKQEKGLLALAQGSLFFGLSSYYYQLNDTLLIKSGKLAASGALLLLAAAWLTRAWGWAERAKTERQGSWRAWASLAALLLICAGVSHSAYKAESFKSMGKEAYLELAPRDPRDPLMGDYMALNYSVANEIRNARYQLFKNESDGPGQAWCVLGQDKVLRFVTLDSGQAPRPMHYRISYQKIGWNVSLGVDKAYFQEGDEPRFRNARYGHFKILDNGRLVWLGLVGADFKPL